MLAALGCWLLTSLTSGCLDNKCGQIDPEPVRYTDGHTNAARTFYQSSTPDEPFLRFPADRTFHIEHGLREMPVDVSVFLSFEASGFEHSLAAGDEALLTLAPEHPEYIRITNNTCADFFVRVTAWTQPQETLPANSEAPASDAAAAPPLELLDGAALPVDGSPQ
jgi:hypothetical protein